MGTAPAQPFDAIRVDIDHAPDQLLGEASAAFYRHDGLRAEPVSFFNDLADEEITDWIFLAR